MDNRGFGKGRRKGKTWIGIIFLIIGTVMLSKTMGVILPNWIFSWPMFFILLGLFMGMRHQFKNPSSLILIIIGSIFLIDSMLPGIDFDDFVFPAIFMGLGLHLIVNRNKNAGFKGSFAPREPVSAINNYSWDKRVEPEEQQQPSPEPDANANPPHEAANPTHEDYLDTVSIFGGVKKTIVSKNFRGGEIVTVMGGAEINLTQADIITPNVVLDVTQVFGGTKIVIPPHWKVSSELVAVFGGTEDRRQLMSGITPSDEKHLIIRGTSIFGGIDIRSF